MNTRAQVPMKPAAAPARPLPSAPFGILQRKCACGGSSGSYGGCEECRKKALQRRAVGRRPETAPAIVDEVLRSAGQPLNAGDRAFFEPRFGHDFSHVRVHTDERAVQSARAVAALAYTVGDDVVFGAGQYAPHTGTGRRLLAHELAHTVQQSAAGSSHSGATLPVSQPGDAAEREADAVTDRVILAGECSPAAAAVHHTAPALQRRGDLGKVPPGLELRCELPSDSPASTVDFVLFPNDGSTLTPLQRMQIDNFVVNWRAAGANAPVRVDGFASTPGSDELNWGLSCDRAQAVFAELISPTSGDPGIPAGLIRTVAQGETTEFGTEANNRRATISSNIGPPPPPQPLTCAGGAQPVPKVAVCVQPIVVAESDGSAPLAAPSFAEVVRIWGKCCLDVTINGTIVVANSALKEIDDAGSGAPMTAEETTLFASAGSGCIPVATVDTIRRGASAGKGVAGGGTTKDIGTNQPKVIVDEGADPTVVAHEVGHALTLAHSDDVGGRTVMHPSGAFNVAVPDGVTANICNKARVAPVATGSVATPCCETTI